MALIATILTLAALACAPPVQSEVATSPPAQGILAPTELVPADITLFVHIKDAAVLRRSLSPRPVAQGATALMHDAAIGKAWSSLSQRLNVNEGSLFDLCFGRSVTLVARDNGQWAVITDLGERRTRELLRLLNVRMREPRFGLAVSELPEQEVLLASDGGQVVIGPASHAELFMDVLQLLGGAGVERASILAADSEFRKRVPEVTAGLCGADAAVFVRHEQPLGGCSLIIASLQGDQVRLKHSARFDNAPFLSPVTKLDCDFSPVLQCEDHALIALMQPRDVGDGPLENFLSANFNIGLVSPSMRKNLADRRLLVVGEQDARQLPEPSDILTTTFVACLEVKDPEIAAPQLDEQMVRLTRRMNALGEGAYLIEVPDLSTRKQCEARQIDLGEAGKLFAGGFPVMKTVSLNWAVAQGPDASWFVVGSHPQALKDTVASLQAPSQRDDAFVGRFDSCGAANGLRLGRQVQSWGAEAQEFADPTRIEQVRSSLTVLGDLVSGLETCRWQMARPTANTMRLDVQVKLAPPQTAGEK